MHELTIVVYHYVRPIAGSEFSGIKGLEIEGFKKQLDFLVEHYSIVSIEQVIDAVVKNKKLPSKACWLTFDDGYKDHYTYVLPELVKRNLSGSFFPSAASIEEKKMLDVNSVHHILSCVSEINVLVKELYENCYTHGVTKNQISSYYKEFAVPNVFDDGDTIFVKRMLQHVLPKEIRSSITSSLFQKFVGVSEADLSSKLYMSLDEIRDLVNNGMHIGSHGSMHYWLDKISANKQREDISRSLEFLEKIGAPTKDWVMCYPYGSYNETTLSIVKDLGASIGITTELRKADLSVDNPLTLPRLDTNDFPQ